MATGGPTGADLVRGVAREAPRTTRPKSGVIDQVVYHVSKEVEWEIFIDNVPKSILLLGQLNACAAKKDFSLEHDSQRQDHKHMKHPHSFRASLCQVSNQGYWAFREGDKSMTEIKYNCGNAQEHFDNIMHLLLHGDIEEIKDELPLELEMVCDMLGDCAKVAKGIDKKFTDLKELVDEITEAISGVQGKYEEDLKKDESEIKANTVLRKLRQKNTDEAEKQIADLEKKADQAESEYTKLLQNPPGLLTYSVSLAVDATLGNAVRVGQAVKGIFTKSKAPEHDNLVETVRDDYQKELKEHKERFQEAKNAYEAAVKRYREENGELADIIAKIERIRIEEISFEQILQVLEEGVGYLGDVQKKWAKIAKFFEQVAMLVRGEIEQKVNTYFKKFSEKYSGKQLEPKERKKLYHQACTASVRTFAIEQVAETYTEISDKYIMGNISGLSGLLALEPEKDGKLIHDRLRKLGDQCEQNQCEIVQLVTSSRARMEEDIKNHYEERNVDLDAALAPLPAANIEEIN